MVRLKGGEGGYCVVYPTPFQFLMVRLKVNRIQTTIAVDIEFQFLMVRLKGDSRSDSLHV